MRNFTVASLAVFASAAAIKMRSQNQDTTNVGTNGSATNQPAYESWIGKYNFNGAVDNLLMHMDRADLNRNGVVTLGEVRQSLGNIFATAPQYVLDALDQYDDHYDIRDDLYVLTMIALGYDLDGDHMLSLDELTNFIGDYDPINGDAQALIDVYGTVGMDEMLDFMAVQRYGGSTFNGQFENMGPKFQGLLTGQFNANGDNVVTLEEFINAINSHFGNRINKDDILAQFGRDYDWTHDYHLVARLVSEGHDLSDYRQAYMVFDLMSVPWAIDTFYSSSKEDTGITMNELADFVDAYMHMNDLSSCTWCTAPADWKPLHERHITDDFSQVFKDWWFGLDAMFDGDGHVTLRELLDAGNQYGYSLNVDEIINRVGEDFEWYEHPDVFGSIIASKFAYGQDPLDVQHLHYQQVYPLCDLLGHPWLVDTMFGTYKDVGLVGINASELAQLTSSWMYDSDNWDAVPPTGWLYMKDRVYADQPYIKDEADVRQHAKDVVEENVDFIEGILDKLVNVIPNTNDPVELITKADLEKLKQFYYTVISATEFYAPGTLDGI